MLGVCLSFSSLGNTFFRLGVVLRKALCYNISCDCWTLSSGDFASSRGAVWLCGPITSNASSALLDRKPCSCRLSEAYYYGLFLARMVCRERLKAPCFGYI
jgi:hypothetical protein